MARTKRLLNGAAKDAFLKSVLAAEPGLDAPTRERLARALQDAIALIGTRHAARPAAYAAAAPAPAACAPAPAAETAPPIAGPEPGPFDPYSPNVIVVFRTRGRDAALEELHAIEDVECLRLLAREQQLGIASDLADPPSIRRAIVAAAERRVANRRAAAS
jgi:hypothetical protein